MTFGLIVMLVAIVVCAISWLNSKDSARERREATKTNIELEKKFYAECEELFRKELNFVDVRKTTLECLQKFQADHGSTTAKLPSRAHLSWEHSNMDSQLSSVYSDLREISWAIFGKYSCNIPVKELGEGSKWWHNNWTKFLEYYGTRPKHLILTDFGKLYSASSHERKGAFLMYVKKSGERPILPKRFPEESSWKYQPLWFRINNDENLASYKAAIMDDLVRCKLLKAGGYHLEKDVDNLREKYWLSKI